MAATTSERAQHTYTGIKPKISKKAPSRYTIRGIASIILISLTITKSATNPLPNITNTLLPHNGSNNFSQRAAAPPYPDPCESNADCDWGYKCVDGRCHWGCDDQSDCLAPTYCAHCFSCGKFANNCMNTRYRPCGAHLAFCMWNEQCCSGICRRKGHFKLCLPRYRGDSREVDGEDEAEGGDGVVE